MGLVCVGNSSDVDQNNALVDRHSLFFFFRTCLWVRKSPESPVKAFKPLFSDDAITESSFSKEKTDETTVFPTNILSFFRRQAWSISLFPTKNENSLVFQHC